MPRQGAQLKTTVINSAIKAFEREWQEWLEYSKDPQKWKDVNPSKEPPKEPPQRRVLNDGGCLRLIITMNADKTSANARWEFYKKKGKTLAKDYTEGLGSYPLVGVAEAREKRNAIVAKLNAGIDPREERARERAERAQAALEERRKATLFSEVAERYIRANEAVWSQKNPMRALKSRGLVKNHIGPVFDVKPVGDLDFNDAVRFVQSISDKGLSRSLLRKCIDLSREVFKTAQGEGARSLEAPFPFDRSTPYSVLADPIIETLKPEGNFAALAPEDAPEFFADLCAREPSTGRNALIFAMLTALRLNGVTGAKWSAINWEDQKLVVPDGVGSGTRKIKGGGDYDCYLSSYAIAFLKSLSVGAYSPYLFTGTTGGPVSENNVRGVIHRMNKARRNLGLKEWRDYERPLDKNGEFPAVSPHGISRTTYRTWIAEDIHSNDERFNQTAAEMNMDHKTNVEKAQGGSVASRYIKAKRKNRRLEIADAWGRYLVTGKYPDEPDGPPCEGWLKIIGAE